MKIKINETTAAILSKYKNIFFKVIKEKENLYLDFIDTVMIKSIMFEDSSGTEILSVKKFVRFETGEGLEKKNEDFAAEVAAQIAGN